MHKTTQMSLKGIILSEKSQSQKVTDGGIPFVILEMTKKRTMKTVETENAVGEREVGVIIKGQHTGPGDFIGEFYQKFREPMCSNSSRKLQRKENSQTHSMRPPSR